MKTPDADHATTRAFVTGEWRVTPSRNLLEKDGVEVRVEPRVMDVLVDLTGRAGSVVSKEELVQRVWEGRFVTDDVLTVTIYALRKALGDEARHPRYIETVSRRGYRWIAPVAPLEPAAPPHPASSFAKASETRSPAASGWRGDWARHASWTTAARVAALLLFALGAAWVLTPARHERRQPNAASREAYVKGRYYLDQRSVKGWQQALDEFRWAVALDPQSPAAHAGLADTYSAMSDFGVASPAEMRPLAVKSARRALELDARSAEGHEALGRAQFLFDWDFKGAERSLKRALELDADSMPANQATAWLESARGRYPQAIAAARRALQIDPINTARYTELAWVLALAGRTEEARHEVDRALQLDPRSLSAHVMRGWTYELTGQPESAFAAYREGFRLSGAPEEALRQTEAVYRAEGLTGFYRRWIERQPKGSGGPLSNTYLATVYVRAGLSDRAIESLERALERRESALAWVNVEPNLQRLRSDARFQRIAARVGHAAVD